MKFKDTKRLSPVIYENDVPRKTDLFHYNVDDIPINKKDYQKFILENSIVKDKAWWYKQYARCINGYEIENGVIDGGDCFVEGKNVKKLSEGNWYIPDLAITIKNNKLKITGRHYFYLNFWKIKRKDDKTGRKIIANPKFTDLSFENWWIRDRMFREKKDNLWAKRRQGGFSEEEACDLAYDFLFLRDTQGAIAAGEEKYAENLMNFVKRGIKQLRNSQFYKKLGTNRDDYFNAIKFGSEIHSRTCKDNPQALSSLSPSKVKMEEIGIWQKGLVKETAEFIDASLEAEGEKTGFKQYIGTGGDMEDGVADMEEMFWNPSKFNLLEFNNYYEDNDGGKIARFVPAYKFHFIDEDGNSFVEKSKKDLARIAKNKSPKERYRFITQKPIKPSDIFNISSGGFFGPEISQWCNERRAFINTHKDISDKIIIGNLEWIHDLRNWEAGVKFVPDEKNGRIVMFEPPDRNSNGGVYENLYKVGTDSYDQDETKVSKSKGACLVRKGFRNANSFYDGLVAYTLQRPSFSEGGREVFYEDTAKLTVFYNGINLIEHTKILIFDWYIKNGLFPLLKEKPEAVIARKIKNSQSINDFGLDGSFIPYALKMLKDYLSKKESIERMFFPEILRAIPKFKVSPNYNCDITIAFALTQVLIEDEMDVEVVDPNEYQEQEDFSHFTMGRNGLISA